MNFGGTGSSFTELIIFLILLLLLFQPGGTALLAGTGIPDVNTVLANPALLTVVARQPQAQALLAQPNVRQFAANPGALTALVSALSARGVNVSNVISGLR